MAYRLSRYESIIDTGDGGSVIAYNSLSGRISLIDEARYIDLIRRLANEGVIEKIDSDEFRTMNDKGIIVDEKYDERALAKYILFSNVIRSDTLNVILVMSRQCNFRCVYCYEKHEDLYMSDDVCTRVRLWIERQLADRRYRKVQLLFFGGEPLLSKKQIIRLTSEIAEYCSANSVEYTAGMSTNGYLLDRTTLTKLVALRVTDYQITIDGRKEDHDRMRIHRNGTGTWDRIVSNLRQAKDSQLAFNITVRVNYNEEILSGMNEFVDAILDVLTDKRFTLYFERIKKLGGNRDSELCVMNDLDELVANMQMIGDFVGKGIVPYNHFYFTLPCSLVCYAGNPNSFVIDYDGKVRKCTLELDNELNQVGYIDDNGELHLNHRKHAPWVCSDYDDKQECRECKMLPLCFGKKCPKVAVIDRLRPGSCQSEMTELYVAEVVKSYVRLHQRNSLVAAGSEA
jgi:uncharacterized protein